MFQNCTLKYRQFISGVNDSVDIVFPTDSGGVVITRNVPMNQTNADYAEILKQVADGDIIIEPAE